MLAVAKQVGVIPNILQGMTTEVSDNTETHQLFYVFFLYQNKLESSKPRAGETSRCTSWPLEVVIGLVGKGVGGCTCRG